MQVPDHSTREGAEALAERIREDWAEQGISITTTIHRHQDGYALKASEYWMVRSDLENFLRNR